MNVRSVRLVDLITRGQGAPPPPPGAIAVPPRVASTARRHGSESTAGDLVVGEIEILALELHTLASVHRDQPAHLIREALRKIESCLTSIRATR